MYFELLIAFAAISRLVDEWQPDRRPRATLLSRKGPKR